MTISWVINFLFGSGVLIAITKYVINRIKANDIKTQALSMGVQALLKERLITTYYMYLEKGYAPIHAKENFENMWQQYHNLGGNGIIKDLFDRFRQLPDREVKECD